MLLRLLAVLAVVAAAVVTFFVWHHPPMRLMPAPLLFHDDGSGLERRRRGPGADSRIEVFYATNRLPVGAADDRTYTVAPDWRLHVGTATLRIGDEGIDPRPAPRMVDARHRRPAVHPPRADGRGGDGRRGAPRPAWLAEIDAALAASRSRDILVYVHGANTTVERAAGQAAQIRHFAGREAVVVLFAWPTAENFLRYSRDIDTAFGASPHLADLIALLAEHTARRTDRRLHLQRRRHGRQRRARLARPRAAGGRRPRSARSTTPRPMPISAASSTTSTPTRRGPSG